jgi:hypothetical protein
MEPAAMADIAAVDALYVAGDRVDSARVLPVAATILAPW